MSGPWALLVLGFGFGVVVGSGCGPEEIPAETEGASAKQREAVGTEVRSGRRLESPYLDLPHWCKGALHAHTEFHSLSDMALAYKKKGFHFLFITDHDALSDVSQVSAPRAFPGEEVSAREGHVCALFSRSVLPKEIEIHKALDEISDQGGLAQLNHPTRSQITREQLDRLSGLWGMEVRNGKTPDDGDLSLWDGQLAQGKRLWGTFTDDAHDFEHVGQGWILVNSADSGCGQQAVLAGLRGGNFTMSRGPALAVRVADRTVSVESDREGTIRWLREKRTVIRTTKGSRDSYTVDGSEPFVRVELTDKDGKQAFSQPIFVSE